MLPRKVSLRMMLVCTTTLKRQVLDARLSAALWEYVDSDDVQFHRVEMAAREGELPYDPKTFAWMDGNTPSPPAVPVPAPPAECSDRLPPRPRPRRLRKQR